MMWVPFTRRGSDTQITGQPPALFADHRSWATAKLDVSRIIASSPLVERVVGMPLYRVAPAVAFPGAFLDVVFVDIDIDIEAGQ
jgi:hypothetical protein